MRFAKWQGLGNDYVVVEASGLPRPLTPEAIALLCDRHYGVGSDGILIREEPLGVPDAVARMRIFNPDGSEAEMCGNGARIFARYLEALGRVEDDEFVVETRAGPIRLCLLSDGRVRVHMGRVRFVSENLMGGIQDTGEVVGRSFAQVDPHLHDDFPALDPSWTFTFVDVGNPHCVIPVADVDQVPLETVGPLIEHLPWFPNRTNVEFVQMETDGSATVRVWERGVGETQACGTGATAVAATAIRLGLARSPVLVHLRGGHLEIEVFEDYQAVMTGPAEEVFSGELSRNIQLRLGWAT